MSRLQNFLGEAVDYTDWKAIDWKQYGIKQIKGDFSPKANWFFTRVSEYGFDFHSKIVVKDAVIKITSSGLVWENGTWIKGDWLMGTWKNGIWQDGIWKDGIWENGIWNNGQWKDGLWRMGTWYKGFWINGTWKAGIWNNGVWHEGTWESGVWKAGSWVAGKWKNGWINDPNQIGNFKPDWQWSKSQFVNSPISPKEYFKK